MRHHFHRTDDWESILDLCGRSMRADSDIGKQIEAVVRRLMTEVFISASPPTDLGGSSASTMNLARRLQWYPFRIHGGFRCLQCHMYGPTVRLEMKLAG
ncbi:hypothetical protein DC522_12150 [Microvirga sp. KLBC 81]|uniref:hypothetical protein n=1 Tax=Microvirga sp. KLBC 81 TaxID=1862707 RepID=UPI000D523AC1|nr:hypothetical protein [Microvirga sp. KLBC 81]PVE24046.1 hypothetical protein DC522_12150 [Microvirga sp. KLBC 81]